MNNRCNFCRDYKNLKRIERKYADSENCNPDANIEMSNSYKVTLVSITKSRRKETSNWRDVGQTVHYSHPIHYCPVCGRRLR